MKNYPNETLLREIGSGMLVTVFRPNLLHIIPQNSGNLETEHGIALRFFYRMLIGYRIFLLRKDDAFISYVMFQKGRIARYPFVKKNNLLMGPYYVDTSQRGHAYSKQLIEIALNEMQQYTAVFAWILSDNEPSLKTVANLGFERVGWMEADRVRKSLVKKTTLYEVWKKDLRK